MPDSEVRRPDTKRQPFAVLHSRRKDPAVGSPSDMWELNLRIFLSLLLNALCMRAIRLRFGNGSYFRAEVGGNA